MTTGLREVSERARKDPRGTAVGVYYVLTYLGFGLPFVHAIVSKTLSDAKTLQVTAAVALGCLLLRAPLEAQRQSGSAVPDRPRRPCCAISHRAPDALVSFALPREALSRREEGPSSGPALTACGTR
jgi:hypothetical protein